jgi:nucleoside-diphosphate-sugar epimerase
VQVEDGKQVNMDLSKPILVTGSAGFIDFHFARPLIQQGLQ